MPSSHYNANITNSVSFVNTKEEKSESANASGLINRLSAKKLSSKTTSSLEDFFEWYGRLLARHPLKSVGICLLIPLLCGVGLINFRSESNPYKLWIPQDSDYIRNHEWLWENFPPDTRFNSIILTAENVLTPNIVQEIFKIHKIVANITSKDGKTFEDICYKIPYIDTEPLMELLEDFGSDYDEEEEEDDEELTTLSPPTKQNKNADSTSLNEDFKKSKNNPISTGLQNSLEDSSKISRKRRSSSFDPSIELYPSGDYCDLIDDLSEYRCFENSLLELWASDNYSDETEDILKSLTQKDIIDAVNNDTKSKVFGIFQDFSKYLGSIQRNETGHIIGAKATFIRFFGKVNMSSISEADKAHIGSPVDEITLNWEQALIETLQEGLGNSEFYQYYFNVAKSFSDLADEAIQGDAFVFGVGTGIVFVYVQFMLGNLNFVEQRPGLSSAGIGCCALGILTCYGLCSGLNLVFSPMHAIIPFLMLGIGIDDMFVIVQCHSNLIKQGLQKDLSHEEMMGLTMKHAGVAITITSVTNMLVFAIGASTALPALQSFCLYCAVGIAAVYIYQATIFAALFSIDTKRIEARRNGCLPCYKHKNWEPNQLSQRNIMQNIFEGLGKFLVHPVSKVFVIIVTLGFVSIGGWGLSMLKTEFNPIKFIPQDCYLAEWFSENNVHFPKEGERVKINIANINYTSELPKIDHLVKELSLETEILSSVDSWYTEFKNYTEKNDLLDGEHWFDVFRTDQLKFYQVLTQFLFSPSGAKYRGSFNFMNELVCGEAASEIQLSSIDLTHKLFSGPSEWIPAMNKVKKIVEKANFSSRAFPVATEYASWETDEIISEEVYRNMGLSLVCVFITTLLLISNIPACLMVLLSLILTLVNIGGFMHFWGLTIDVISCINLVIAVGLCVDYSAHITHCFMGQTGTRDERAVKTLRDIGPAVLNGGISTFLAFVLTAGSTSHVFSTFFKIFFLVVVFGLFHAIIFLPVILSILGPAAPVQEQVIQPADEECDGNMNKESVEVNSCKPTIGLDNKSFITDENSSNFQTDQLNSTPDSVRGRICSNLNMEDSSISSGSTHLSAQSQSSNSS